MSSPRQLNALAREGADMRAPRQLMVGRGLRIMDLRHTLPNLMNLLLTVSSDRPM